VRIVTPLQEARIATVFRGIGPKGVTDVRWNSLDNFLTMMATKKGANLINERVSDLSWQNQLPQVKTRNGITRTYDLLVVAGGVNAATARLMSGLDIGYKLPKTTQTSICEFYLGAENVDRYFGNAIHVFLLDTPKVDFAMFIPKDDFVTFCILGVDLDSDTIEKTLKSPEIQKCLPPGWQIPENYCRCKPNASISDAVHPYSDRIITIGDCGITRLYKDGIGAAYKTGKAAAVNSIFNGISGKAFEKYYASTYKRISRDNIYGRIVFRVTRIIRRVRFIRHGVINTLIKEQKNEDRIPYLGMVLWDTFTGSAPYRDVVFRSLHPTGFFRLVGNVILSLISFRKK
jgi:flavin-dependent dehydrogenase